MERRLEGVLGALEGHRIGGRRKGLGAEIHLRARKEVRGNLAIGERWPVNRGKTGWFGNIADEKEEGSHERKKEKR